VKQTGLFVLLCAAADGGVLHILREALALAKTALVMEVLGAARESRGARQGAQSSRPSTACSCPALSTPPAACGEATAASIWGRARWAAVALKQALVQLPGMMLPDQHQHSLRSTHRDACLGKKAAAGTDPEKQALAGLAEAQ